MHADLHANERHTQRMPELLILCQLFYPELVSTGQTLTELAEQLVADGVDVEVLCGPPTVMATNGRMPKRMIHRGIRIRRVWGTRFPKLSLVGRVLNQMTFTCSIFFHLLLHRPRRLILVLTNPPFLAVTLRVVEVLSHRSALHLLDLRCLSRYGRASGSSCEGRIHRVVLGSDQSIRVQARCGDRGDWTMYVRCDPGQGGAIGPPAQR